VAIIHTWPVLLLARLTYARLDTARRFSGREALSSASSNTIGRLLLPFLVIISIEFTECVASALAFPLLDCKVLALLVSSSDTMDVTGVSGAIDSRAEVKTGDATESGVLATDNAAIRFDLRVTLSVMVKENRSALTRQWVD